MIATFRQVLIPLLLVTLWPTSVLAASSWWTEESLQRMPVIDDETTPRSYTPYRIDTAELGSILSATPKTADPSLGTVISLPTPDGQELRVRVVETTLLSPEMQLRRPDIRAYKGVGVSDPTLRVRMGVTGEGFHARVTTRDARGFTMESIEGFEEDVVAAYYRQDAPLLPNSCFAENVTGNLIPDDSGPMQRRLGTNLLVYDLAVSTPGEFEDFLGSVAAVENRIAATVNLVNLVYENELGVNFQIVDFNVYTNPGSDPFSSGTTLDGLMISQNHSALISKLGSNGFDVGHVLVYISGQQGNSGIAALNSLCSSGSKGAGGSGSGSPTSSSLADVMLHELGHQFGAGHSFNTGSGGCGDNRSASQAYELGSGVTIMSYAGRCPGETILNSDLDFFNAGALQRITSLVNSRQFCVSATPAGNTPPTADAGPNVTIPRDTGFILEGNPFDADGDPMTHAWEQYDLGPATPPIDPSAGPLFRNFLPKTESVRFLPEYEVYRRNLNATFETLPSVDRTVTFRYVVRDNNPVAGGTAWDTKTITVSGDPFEVTSPNGGESFVAGTDVTLTWNVGGGSVASDVAISYSSDGGLSWVEVLASTPNDGSVAVPLPCEVTTEGKLRIDAVDNIFYALSNSNFTVTPDEQLPVVTCPATATVNATGPEGVASSDPAIQDVLGQITAEDNCDPDVVLTSFPPATFPLGDTIVATIGTDDAGNIGTCITTFTVVEATDAPNARIRTALLGAAPNPFNPRTTLRFSLERAQATRLEILDVRGRRVAVIVDGVRAAGEHEVVWNGEGDGGRPAPSGVYFVRLVTEEGEFTDRVALLK